MFFFFLVSSFYRCINSGAFYTTSYTLARVWAKFSAAVRHLTKYYRKRVKLKTTIYLLTNVYISILYTIIIYLQAVNTCANESLISYSLTWYFFLNFELLNLRKCWRSNIYCFIYFERAVDYDNTLHQMRETLLNVYLFLFFSCIWCAPPKCHDMRWMYIYWKIYLQDNYFKLVHI